MMRLIGALALATLVVGSTRAEDFEMDGLKSKLPASWKKEETGNAMRAFQAKLPKVDGDAEDAALIVFFFGKGQGGGIDDNIKRWKDQFVAPEGKKIDDVSKLSDFKINGDKVKVTYLVIDNATYKFNPAPFNPNSTITEKKDFSMLGAIVESPNGPYFIRVTGPKKTVDSQKKAFEDWIKAFK